MQFVSSKNMDPNTQIGNLVDFLSESFTESLPDQTKIDFEEHEETLKKCVR